MSLLFSTSFAQRVEIQPGNYVLSKGPQAFCSSFELKEKDLKGKQLRISQKYGYNLETSKKETKSDIDENCTFRELNYVLKENGQTQLQRVNEEICSGKIISRVNSKLEIMPDSLRLIHQLDNAARFSCHWNRE